jgi:hypothetical protein
VAAASRRHRTRELTGGEVTRLRECAGMHPDVGSHNEPGRWTARTNMIRSTTVSALSRRCSLGSRLHAEAPVQLQT